MEQNARPLLLRSYNSSDSSDPLFKDLSLWGACRATSAATSYFNHFQHGNVKLVDGAIAYNNPVLLVSNEAKNLWTDREMLLISVGTGNAPGNSVDANAYTLSKSVLPKLLTHPDKAADEFYHLNQEMVDNGLYYRFTVDGLGVLDLGDCHQIPRIEADTLHYLRQGPVGKEMKQCAAKLIIHTTDGKFASSSK